MSWRWLAVLLAAGLAVRLAGLTERGLWLDEWVSLQVAARPLADIAAGRVFDNHTPPLYYLLLHLWLAVAPHTVAGLRALSVIADLGCLALLARAVGSWFGRREGLLAGAAYALSPFAVRLSQEGRMYTLLMLLVVLAGVLAVEVETRPQRRWPAVALAGVAAAALYTHYYAALSLLALHLVMAWRLRRAPRLRRRWWWAMCAAALLFLPWLPKVVELMASGGQYFRGAGLLELPHALLRFTVGYSRLPVTVAAKLHLWATVLAHLPLLVALVLASGTALMLGAWRVVGGSAVRPPAASPAGPPPAGPSPAAAPRRAAVAAPLVLALAALPPLVALAVSAAVPSLDERYLAVSFPFFLVLLVLGLTARGLRPLRTATAAVLCALWLAGIAAQVAEPAAGATPWRPATSELRRAASPGARIVVSPATYARLVRWTVGERFEVERAADLPAPDLGGDLRETWLLEVAYLGHDRGRLERRGWRATLRWQRADGNGIRLYRLAPAGSPPSPSREETRPAAQAAGAAASGRR